MSLVNIVVINRSGVLLLELDLSAWMVSQSAIRSSFPSFLAVTGNWRPGPPFWDLW